MSADGRYVVSPLPPANLVPGDTKGVNDEFVRDRVAGGWTTDFRPVLELSSVVLPSFGRPRERDEGMADGLERRYSGMSTTAQPVVPLSTGCRLLLVPAWRYRDRGVLASCGESTMEAMR